jgi:uncharacterized membrane protein YphA (DoxX/SURF4 family)
MDPNGTVMVDLGWGARRLLVVAALLLIVAAASVTATWSVLARDRAASHGEGAEPTPRIVLSDVVIAPHGPGQVPKVGRIDLGS